MHSALKYAQIAAFSMSGRFTSASMQARFVVFAYPPRAHVHVPLECCDSSHYYSRVVTIQRLWNAALGLTGEEDFQPSQGNKRRIEIYDALINKAQQRAEEAGTVAARRAHLDLIIRLDQRCKREVLRREEQARSLG